MGEILPDGSIQGYQGYCKQCGIVINVNAQGSELSPYHQCNPKCCQLADKKRGMYIHTEKCEAKAKYIITYWLQEKRVIKRVCKMHLNSNKNWLDKIKVEYKTEDIL